MGRCTISIMMITALLVVSAGTGFANGGGEDEGRERPVIGISVIGTEHNWDINAYNGAVERAEELGAKVLAFDGERRTEKQLGDVKVLIAGKVDAILVILGDAQSLTPALAEARQNGIPVVTVDFDNPHTLSNVSTDNETAMAELVEHMVQDLNENGQVGIYYTPGIPVADQRKDVFDRVMAKYPNMEVAAEQPWKIPGTVPDGYDKAQDMLRANPEIDAFWTVFDQPLIGAAQAIFDMGGDMDVRCYGFDGDPAAMEMIMDPGSAYAATVAQQPYIIGQTGAEMALKAAAGEELERYVYVDHILVTRDNAKEVFETLAQYK